jgi:hypothetical protein
MLLNDVYFACEVWFCYRVLGNFTVHFVVSQFKACEASVKLTVIAGLRRNVDEICALLGCYAASSGNPRRARISSMKLVIVLDLIGHLWPKCIVKKGA